MSEAPSIPSLLRAAGDAMAVFLRHAVAFEARFWRDAWLVGSGVCHPLCNWACLMTGGGVGESALRDIVAHFGSRRLPALIYLTEEAEANLFPLADELGLSAPEPVPLMLCRLAELPEPSGATPFALTRATEVAALRAANGVIAATFDVPPAQIDAALGAGLLTEPAVAIRVAREADRAISVATTFRVGPLLYVDIMATSPDRQGRGAGRALLERALADEAAAGAEWSYLIASPEGQRLYDRLGYRTIAQGVTRLAPAPPANHPS